MSVFPDLEQFVQIHRPSGNLTGEAEALTPLGREVFALCAGEAREEDVGRLGEAGLDDAAILEVAFTAAFRLFGSRLYEGLGVEIDPFLQEQEDRLAALPPHHNEALSR